VSRLVVVTGGGSGIGRAVACRYAAAGDEVVVLGRTPGPLAETVALAGPTARAVTCDVTDEDQVRAAFADVAAVDVLVSCAGAATSAPLERTALADWRAQHEVNATGAFLCVRAVLPGMRARDRGRIVVVASTAGLVGARYTAAYTAAKHAAAGLVRAVAAEVAGTGVTANAVCPTFTRTPMTERSVRRIVQRTGRDAAASEAALAAASPLGRLLDPAEVAFAVAFLAAEEAGAINGQALVLDGGGVTR
jgi:NAD(P)-dependent dehydrogenase (short-subunit alcohol dehydrogenase family)